MNFKIVNDDDNSVKLTYDEMINNNALHDGTFFIDDDGYLSVTIGVDLSTGRLQAYCFGGSVYEPLNRTTFALVNVELHYSKQNVKAV